MGVEVDQANAYLMAASPKLLGALKELSAVAYDSVEYSEWPELQSAINIADAAIALATPPEKVR